ncbi:MAG: outer membrane protein assembly factor BamD [Verrucomicrobia bacterium]|nr:outer membrane protein assembly factor BamD [Verrucomicrobiota bacterium]
MCASAPLTHAQQSRDTLIEDHRLTDDFGATKRKQGGWVLHRAKYDNAAAQLAYAEKLQAKGHLRKASKAYNAVVHQWHDTPEAAQAQRQLADVLVKRGKSQSAFDEYQYLIRYFSGTFPYQDVLETQFTLANAVRTARYAKLLFLPGFEDSPRAVPLYEQLVENGPNWERAPEAQFNVGAIQEAADEFELAVVAYETLQLRYPHSELIEEATFRRAQALYQMSLRSPRDEDQLREAFSALLGFVRRYPADPRVADAKRLSEELKQRLADMYYDRAIFYDKLAKKPKSAVIAYTDFIAMFPTSERRPIADERVAALQLEMERRNEN